ncbi:MAG: universal stress protein [Gemmatimonadales bacterium]|nr:MAG: universal stress protein [Gemmatimonadales bacterium]
MRNRKRWRSFPFDPGRGRLGTSLPLAALPAGTRTGDLPVPYRIVVPLDGSRFGERALPLALSVAERTGGSLELITIAVPVVQSAGGRDAAVTGDDSGDRGEVRARAYLDEVADRIRVAGYEGALVRDVISPGNAARSIVRRVAEVEADLVIMTTHGRGPLQRAWLGSTADGVIRRSPCPVLLVRPPDALAETEPEDRPPIDLSARPGPFSRVVIPLDGSEAAERAFDSLPPLLAEGATAHLLRIVAPFVAGGSPYLPHTVREAQDHEMVRRASAEYLDRFRGRVEASGFVAEPEVVTGGQPAVAILRASESLGAGLIAMSTSGRGGAARLLLGSVADKVVRGAPCPVLLSRTPEDA